MEAGLGKCFIPDDEGTPCGHQIEQGEAIGTVMLPGGPAVGHKRCIGAFYMRQQQKEREQREKMVKLAKQSGPGGPVDMSTAEDAIENSSPLVKPEEKPTLEITGVSAKALDQPASEPHILNDDELAKLEEYKRGLLQARVVSPAGTARKAFTEFTEQVNKLGAYVQRLATEYDKVVAERDQARSERDTAKGAGSSAP